MIWPLGPEEKLAGFVSRLREAQIASPFCFFARLSDDAFNLKSPARE
jgi:hypothetical protein